MEEHPHESIDTVFNCVIPYICNGYDRNSISLVCRKWYEIDCLTRKHVTVHVVCSDQPSRVDQRFPYLKSLTLKGLPHAFYKLQYTLQYIDLGPWIKEIVSSFKCLKSLDIRRVTLHDSDLEQIARSRGKDLRVLKIKNCEGLKESDFYHIGRYCNDLRTLCLEDNQQKWSIEDSIEEYERNRKWLHELALNNTRIESFKISSTTMYDDKDLTLLAKSCSQSLVYLKMDRCYPSDLRDIFNHAVNLRDFACCDIQKDFQQYQEDFEQESDQEDFEQNSDQYAGIKFPPNMNISLRNDWLSVRPLLLPLSNWITHLNLSRVHINEDDQCFLFRRFPNLEALYIRSMCGDNVLQVIGESCNKLRKLKTYGSHVTEIGMIALAQGCLELECLHINSSQHISNESFECIGRCLKNLNDFQITFSYFESTITVLDSGIRAMLIGCSKLERLRIEDQSIRQLTYKSLVYIGKYGHNLKYVSLNCIVPADAGLVDSGIQDMLIGCSKLESLRLNKCCGDVTNVGLGYIGKYGHNLRHLSLSGYISCFKEGLIELSKGCPRLRKLEIDDHLFSKQELSTLMLKFQSLRYMWILDRDAKIALLKTRYKWLVDCSER